MPMMTKIHAPWAFNVALLLLTIQFLAVNVTLANAQQLSPSQCKEERQLAKRTCRPMVFGQPASPACCQRVRVSHFECVCPMFTPKLVSILDVNKVIKLFQRCGRRVPRRFKCGSLNFP